jgi:tRNA dimethylallyltransferase
LSSMKQRIIFLVGPTAVGKSKVAVALAKKLKAQIISCDSMQVYRGMDIITSKPSPSLRKKIPHYLIGINPAGKIYNVARYRLDALKALKSILKKGKTPIFVGGTGLYMSILIDGIFKAKSQNKSLRRRLYKEAEQFGSNFLHKKLKKVDPAAALKIHPNDAKRIIRALEVFEATGKPISELQKKRSGLADDFEVKIFCLYMDRDKLYQRIDERVERMFSCGLVAEVKRLLKSKLSKTASCAIGIKELIGYFDGLYDLDESKRLIKHNTRLYAKRQLTWFRKDKRIKWIEVRVKETPAKITERLWSELS